MTSGQFEWERFLARLETSIETLQGYTLQGCQQPPDQDLRLKEVFHFVQQTKRYFQIQAIREVVRDHIRANQRGLVTELRHMAAMRPPTEDYGNGVSNDAA